MAEVSIYVSEAAQNQGIGSILQVFPENNISIYVHEKQGFRKRGTRRQLAQMSYGSMTGEWTDPVLMERRNKIVGN